VILEEFRRFLENYLLSTSLVPPSPTSPNEGNTLIFRALDEEHHLLVEPSSFVIEKSSEMTHFAPAWSLTLQAYGEADEGESFFDGFFDAIDKVTNAVNKAGAYLAVGALAIGGVGGLGRALLGPLDALQNVTGALASATDGISSILDIPSDMLARVASASVQARLSVSSLIDDVERFPDSFDSPYQRLKGALGALDDVQAEVESIQAIIPPQTKNNETEGATETLRPLPTEEISSINTPERARVSTYRLRAGETLREIARRALGSVERWSELAELNGWRDAMRGPSGRLARAGDLVLIPAPFGGAVDLQRGADPYGVDFALDKQNDLVLTDDLTLLNGPPLVEQALYQRLITEAGASPILARYGLPQGIGRTMSLESAGLYSAHTRAQILRDPRVSSVSFVEWADTGDALDCSIGVIMAEGGFLEQKVSLANV
jgi:hypothetical protein